ncbi:hypothetical protein C8R44DRAFT_879441 [Mycena epipterygia]|nr:hypothetical protein C8R44DRAFT_879441 [Mycena epipterygia]
MPPDIVPLRLRKKKRRLTALPVPPTVWPTPFVPPRERGWHRARARSQPIGVEAAGRVAAMDHVQDHSWTPAFEELLSWAKEYESNVGNAHLMNDEDLLWWVKENEDGALAGASPEPAAAEETAPVWCHAGGENADAGPHTDSENPERGWGSDQWRNALALAAHAMRVTDYRDMLLEEQDARGEFEWRLERC